MSLWIVPSSNQLTHRTPQTHVTLAGNVIHVAVHLNHNAAKLIYLNFHPSEVVSRDPQLQVVKIAHFCLI